MKKARILISLLTLCLVSAGAMVACVKNDADTTQSQTDSIQQEVKMENVKLEDGALYCISVADNDTFKNHSITVENFGMEDNSILKLEIYGRNLSQIWRAHDNGDGTYSFENMATGMFMSVQNPKQAKKQKKLSACLEGTNDEAKKWSVRSVDGTIENCVIESTCTEFFATAFKSTKANYVQQEEYAEGSNAQLWNFKKVSDGKGEYPRLLVLSGDNNGSSSCPEIIYHNGVYYNYNMSSTIVVKTSTDMLNWTKLDKTALGTRPGWLTDVSEKGSIWAPGAYKIGDKYYLYYCTSSSGSQNSAIGVAVSDDPAKNDWKDLGMVLRSYHGKSNFNAIDPNVFIDDDGTPYLIYGSYWDGIFMRQLDPNTGKLDETNTKIYHLAKGSHDMEAPYLIKHGDYYYLFVARGGLSKGTYYWAVGRSKTLTGPFLDKDGIDMLSGSGGTRLTEWKEGVEGVGHAQYFVGPDGQAYMVTESWPYRSSEGSGTIRLTISTIVWSDDGWPVTALDKNVLKALGE